MIADSETTLKSFAYNLELTKTNIMYSKSPSIISSNYEAFLFAFTADCIASVVLSTLLKTIFCYFPLNLFKVCFLY